MTNDVITKCCECEEVVDTENGDHYWSAVKEEYLCSGCYESDCGHVSTVHIVDSGGVTKKYFIGDHIRMSEYGDDLHGDDPVINREWASSSQWRGYYETTIEGWTDVLNGWTTGGWDDEVAKRKQNFNQWADDLLRGEIIPPVKVAIVCDPTSNVFSTAITVLTPEPDKLREWMTTEYEGLYEALT